MYIYMWYDIRYWFDYIETILPWLFHHFIPEPIIPSSLVSLIPELVLFKWTSTKPWETLWLNIEFHSLLLRWFSQIKFGVWNAKNICGFLLCKFREPIHTSNIWRFPKLGNKFYPKSSVDFRKGNQSHKQLASGKQPHNYGKIHHFVAG